MLKARSNRYLLCRWLSKDECSVNLSFEKNTTRLEEEVASCHEDVDFNDIADQDLGDYLETLHSKNISNPSLYLLLYPVYYYKEQHIKGNMIRDEALKKFSYFFFLKLVVTFHLMMAEQIERGLA